MHLKERESISAKIRSQSLKERFSNLVHGFRTDKDFTLFLIVGIFSGIAGGINSTVFNNFLSDVYKLSASARGIVEFPRELPGASIIIVLGLLSFLGDIRMSMAGMIFASLGMLGLGMFSPTFATMLIWMMILSLGTHIFLPLYASIGMGLSEKEEYGARLGKYNAYNLVATIIGYAIVWCGFKYFNFTYKIVFALAAVSYIFAAFFLGLMNAKKPKIKRAKFVFRKEYSLYYVLCLIYGARKQIFLTFAPWVLIQVYHLDPPTFAILGCIIAGLSIVTRTIVGNAIDVKGEKFVLSLEAIILVVICLGYSFAADIAPKGTAVIIIAACYIIDNSMSVVEMARSTYVKKIALCPEDVTPTLSAGTSFDHVIAMSIPFLGGIIWATVGYKYVFLVAAFIAFVNIFLTRRIQLPSTS
jgi:MFS family permease